VAFAAPNTGLAKPAMAAADDAVQRKVRRVVEFGDSGVIASFTSVRELNNFTGYQEAVC